MFSNSLVNSAVLMFSTGIVLEIFEYKSLVSERQSAV